MSTEFKNERNGVSAWIFLFVMLSLFIFSALLDEASDKAKEGSRAARIQRGVNKIEEHHAADNFVVKSSDRHGLK